MVQSCGQMFPQLDHALRSLEEALNASGTPPPRRDPPTVVLVGARGVGKTSLMQSLAGRYFLPPGIPTLRPLQVSLQGGVTESVGLETPHGMRRLADMAEATAALTAEMRRASTAPVRLHVARPGASVVTLVELPLGAEDALGSYVGGGNSVFLAVTSAVAGESDDDAVAAAVSKADPRGVRTLGVVTKLDLVADDGPLPTPRFRRGCVGVVCGGVEDAKAEMWFSRRRGATPWPVGAANLRRAVEKELAARVRDRLRQLEDVLRGRLLAAEAEASFLRPDAGYGLLFRLVGRLRAAFHGEVEGGPGIEGRLSCGANIADIFHKRLAAEVAEVATVADPEVALREATLALRNARGVRTGVFASDRALDALVRNRLRGLRTPLSRCVTAVGVELVEAAVRSGVAAADGYPALRQEATRVIAAEVRRLEVECGAELLRYVEREISYTNTRHEDLGVAGRLGALRRGRLRGGWFVLTSEALSCYKDAAETDVRRRVGLDEVALCDAGRRVDVTLVLPDGRRMIMECVDEKDADAWRAALRAAGVPREGVATSPALRQAAVLAELAAAYVGVVAKTAKDQAPKIVVHSLVDAVRSFVDADLLAALCDVDARHSLTEECPQRAAAREGVRGRCVALRRAVDALRLPV